MDDLKGKIEPVLIETHYCNRGSNAEEDKDKEAYRMEII